MNDKKKHRKRLLPASLCAKIMDFSENTRIIEVVLNERAVYFGKNLPKYCNYFRQKFYFAMSILLKA